MKKAKFVMFDGPSSNSYLAPSGTDYKVIKDTPFVVEGEDDIAYFEKKKSTFRKEGIVEKAKSALKGKKKEEPKEEPVAEEKSAEEAPAEPEEAAETKEEVKE